MAPINICVHVVGDTESTPPEFVGEYADRWVRLWQTDRIVIALQTAGFEVEGWPPLEVWIAKEGARLEADGIGRG